MTRTPQIAPLAGMSPLGLSRATERETLAGITVDQAIIPGVAPISQDARLIAARRHARGAAQLPLGGLFDQVARAQLDLFG